MADPALREMSCLVIDIQLGGMNGFDLCERLDALHLGMPRIFITAHAESVLPNHLRQCALLIKPFGEHQLIDSIEKSLGAGE